MRKDLDLRELILQKEEVAEVKWICRRELAAMAERNEIFVYPELWDICTLALL